MDDLTVGDLRAKLDGLPDDMPVLSVSSHDDASRLNAVHVDVVKETAPRSGTFRTYLTPEEFAEHCGEDGTLLPNSIYTERDRPPVDGVLALTLWR